MKYLVPYKGPEPKPRSATLKKPDYILEAGSAGTKTVTKKAGKGTVEYVVAEGEGVDGISVLDSDAVTAIPSEKSVDHIEKGYVAGSPQESEKPVKPQYRTVDEAKEAEILKDTTQDIEFDDQEVLVGSREVL